MRHARRNEIYRDVGSSERDPEDSGFIEIESFPMPQGSLLLLCSDGLTDLVSSAEILAGVERYAPDFDAAIRAPDRSGQRRGRERQHHHRRSWQAPGIRERGRPADAGHDPGQPKTASAQTN